MFPSTHFGDNKMSWRTDSWLPGVSEGRRAGCGMGEALGTESWILIVVAVT